ncbi:hypothetical protein L7F22_031981 [Adiantum nelumboides]|nr:hypothetical protein [Adiantum nelumboides]
MDHAPPLWGFPRAESSFDSPGPVLVRVYVIRRTKKGMSLSGSRQSSMLSFHLPFAGSQDWTEQLCTEFVHDHTMRAIQSWAGCLPEFLMMQHFSQSVGAVQSLDTDACFCLPIVFSIEATYPLPRTMRGSTAKPEELYHIVEHFALGQRRLELFGEDHNIRNGWITVGKNLTSSNFNAQTFCKFVGDADGKVWQGGRGNPPIDAPHLVGTTPEIEALRPKSPPPRAQQQQQSQAANSVSQPSAAQSNSKKAQNASQGMSPQNLQATSAGGSGQVVNSSSVIVISTTSPSPGQGPPSMGKGGNVNKQARQSPLHFNGGQGKAGSEEDKGTGLDGALDTTAVDQELKPLSDVAS